MNCKKRVWILSIIALLLIQIVFSEQESYSPLDAANSFFLEIQSYSKIIDFFVFFVIFTTVSLIGLKAMFKDKETNKQIIALAIAIGVMSSLALIFGGTFLGREISVFTLFPYALGFLIFCVVLLPIFLIFHFLMGKKHPVWAFIIALIITLLLYFLLIRPIAFPSTLQDSGKSGSSFMEDLSKVFSSGKKAEAKKSKPTTKKPSEKVNGTENKTVSGKPDEKEQKPPAVTKSEPCNEISSFTVENFFDKIWDKDNDKYKDKGDDELKRLDGLHNKCRVDKDTKVISAEDFYTATMNY
ncbi:MAG: hypothetical protein AABY14_04905, partial [Nanoarchaeota archaeon]